VINFVRVGGVQIAEQMYHDGLLDRRLLATNG